MQMLTQKKKVAKYAMWLCMLFFMLIVGKLLFDMTFYETIENKRSELYDTANHVNLQLSNKLSALKLLMMRTDLQNQSTEALRRELQGVFKLGFFDASVYDQNGNFIAKASPAAGSVEYLDDIEGFQEAMDGVEMISDKVVNPYMDDAYIVFSVPIVDPQKNTKGVLIAQMYLTEINRTVNEFYSSYDQYHFILDAKGQYIQHPHLSDMRIYSANMQLMENKYVSQRPSNFLVNSFLGDVSQMYLYTNLEHSSWRLVKVIPTELIYKEIFLTLVPYLSLITLGSTIVILSAWLVYRERKHQKVYEKMRLDHMTSASQIAAGIAHEIKNPLTSIKGFIHLMIKKDKQNFKEDYLSIMLTEVERIELLTNQFCMLARPLETVNYTNFDLMQVTLDIVTLVKRHAEEKGVNLDFVLPKQEGNNKSLFFIHGNVNQIKQILINILRNAIEATGAGGHVNISLLREKKMINIRISDDGEGMSSDAIKKLGTPFYTTKESGTGLGLLVCFEIIRQHTGVVDIESTLGSGTTFEIRIPERRVEIESSAL